MKRRNRLLALLTALCLAVSVLAIPVSAAGESVEQLKQELAVAQKTLEDAQTALAAVQADETKATEAVEAAKKALQDKIDAAGTTTGDDGIEIPNEVDTSQEDAALAMAEESERTAKENTQKAQTAVSEAQAVVSGLQDKIKEAEEAENNQGTQNPPTTPSSNDLSCTASVDFGKLAKGTTSDLSRTFTITNRSQYNMTLSASSVSGYTISGASGTLSAGSSTTVTVRLDSTSAVGNYNGTLALSASFVDGTGSYPFTVALYAEVVEGSYSLTADPSTKDFGKLAEGYEEKAAKDLEITVTIQNKGASSVQMNGVKGNDHFTVTAVRSESETLKNGEKTDYKIAPKKGLAVGTYTDTITFQTREGTTVTFKATVAVEKKVDPLTVSPTVLSFGTVEEGYAALGTQTVTIKNNTDRAIQLVQPTSYSYDISPLPQSALAAGSSTTFTIRPRTGLPANTYSGDIYISGGGEQAKLSVQFVVTRPAGPTTFNDVAANSTFAADIAYVSQKGLMSGVGGGNFNPQAPVTRGQLVTILYRLEGQPAVSGVGFSDVAAGSYCEKAVKWAAATGITTGGNDGLFKPNAPITREQLATFLYRYNRHKGYFTFSLADLSTFPDVGSVSSYAKDALSWANGAKLVNGTSDGRLNPSGGATRGQAAAILHRYCTSIGQ